MKHQVTHKGKTYTFSTQEAVKNFINCIKFNEQFGE